MIDIHSHILYGLDDGSQSPEETLAMARQAVEQGITGIVATPHHLDGTYVNPPDKVQQRIEDVKQLLYQHQIPLEVLAGMEIHVYGDVVDDLKNRNLITYNHLDRHILLELPHDHVPRYMEKLIFDIQCSGYVPIIPHPERNKEIRETPNQLYRLVKQGAMAQLTAASVVGKFGKKIQKCSFDLIEHHMIQFIATDAHNVGNRGFTLKEAYEVVHTKFGQDYVALFQESAQKIIQGKDCLVIPPEKVRKKFLGIF